MVKWILEGHPGPWSNGYLKGILGFPCEDDDFSVRTFGSIWRKAPGMERGLSVGSGYAVCEGWVRPSDVRPPRLIDPGTDGGAGMERGWMGEAVRWSVCDMVRCYPVYIARAS